jgi:hypothetical protein
MIQASTPAQAFRLSVQFQSVAKSFSFSIQVVGNIRAHIKFVKPKEMPSQINGRAFLYLLPRLFPIFIIGRSMVVIAFPRLTLHDPTIFPLVALVIHQEMVNAGTAHEGVWIVLPRFFHCIIPILRDISRREAVISFCSCVDRYSPVRTPFELIVVDSDDDRGVTWILAIPLVSQWPISVSDVRLTFGGILTRQDLKVKRRGTSKIAWKIG